MTTPKKPRRYSSNYAFAKEYLPQHPELHCLSGRGIAEAVKERKIDRRTWIEVKKEMGLPSLPRGNHKTTYHPRKQVQETRTYTITNGVNKAQIEVKATDGTDEVYRIHPETMAFLVYVLLKKEYDFRKSVPGKVIFTKSERMAR